MKYLVTLHRIQGLPHRVTVSGKGNNIGGELAIPKELQDMFKGRQELTFEATVDHGVLTLHENVGSR